MLRDRRPSTSLFALAVVLVAVALVVGFVGGTFVKSPAQVVADTAAPPETVLTEPVRRAAVTQTVAFDGQVQRQFSTAVVAPTTEDGTQVVTRLPARAGERLTAGDLVAEVSGRPVFVFEGRLPSYRTLAPGATGPDVRQLQRALARRGFAMTDVRGTYGAATSAAVEALYLGHGYAPVEVGVEEVRAAEDADEAARRALARLVDAKADRLSRTYAREDAARAARALAEARSRAGAQVGAGEVVYVASLPATVASVDTRVGQTGASALLTVASGPLVVRGIPPLPDRDRIALRQRARLLLTPSGEVAATVTRSEVVPVAAEGEDDDPAASGPTLTLTPHERLPRSSAGTPVRVMVSVSVSAQVGLTVPVSAVSVSADGNDHVIVLRDGRKESVDVTPGASGDGYVQVAPDQAGGLVVGDRVVVGVGR